MFIIECPGPIPTINNMYSRNRFGRRFISEKHRDFKEKLHLLLISQLINRHKPVFRKERIRLTIEVYFKRRGRDIDNIVKPIQDALKGIMYRDDSQVDELIVKRMSDKEENEKLIIKLSKL